MSRDVERKRDYRWTVANIGCLGRQRWSTDTFFIATRSYG